MNRTPINPEDFAKRLSEAVKGQDEAIEYLSFLARMYDLQRLAEAYHFNDEAYKEFPRVVLMLTGTTGGGKTFLVKEFAKTMNLPYHKIDCSQVTGDGWVGLSVSDAVQMHLAKAPDGRGILHLDEFDKILPSNGPNGDDENSNFMASKMNSFLELLDGDFAGVPNQRAATPPGGAPNLALVNKSLIICSGSFQQARDKEQFSKDNPKRSIGFSALEHDIEDDESMDWKEKMTQLGYMKELAGRISHSIELQPYKVDDIIDIIKTSKCSIYKKYLHMLGSQNELSDEELRELAKQAAGSEAGLRILNSLLFEKFFKSKCWKWDEKL